MKRLLIEDIEAELHEYFSSVEYLPAEVKSCAILMSQDLGHLVANLISVHGGDVNWSDGSYRGAFGPYPIGYTPQTYTTKGE
jgi:hypothetical protein